ncbi:hypothetical protein ACOSQ2_028676 [Xanthoceras sorbifolium]
MAAPVKAVSVHKLCLCLVGRLLASKHINRESFRSIIPRIWRSTPDVDIELVSSNTFAFYFENQIDRRRVLTGGPWSFDNFLLILEKPQGIGSMADLSFDKTDFCVQIHNAPLLYMNREAGNFLNGLISEVMDIDVEAMGDCVGHYLRVRVVVDVSDEFGTWLRASRHALMTIKGSLSTEEAVLLPPISVSLSSTGQVGGDDETTVIKRKEKWKRWSRDSMKVEATSTHEFNGKRRHVSFPLGASSPNREGWSARHFHFQSCWAVLDECGENSLLGKSLIAFRGWIIKTCSEKAIGLVIGLNTTLAVWEALKDAYAHDSQEREFTLRQQLTYLRKDDHKTIGDHICIFKGLCDNLTTIGKPTPDKEKVFCLLTSLGPQYETFTTTMLKPPRPTYSKLISQLQNLDQRRNWFSNQSDASLSQLTPHLAFYG